MDDMYRATQFGTREDVAAARRAIKVFNKTIRKDKAIQSFIINSASLRSSIKQKTKKQNLRDRGLGDNQRLRRLDEHLEGLYPEDPGS